MARNFFRIRTEIKDVELLEETSQNEAGKILDICKDYIIVGCKNGSLKIKTLQAPSKKAINSVDFVRGQRVEIGDILA